MSSFETRTQNTPGDPDGWAATRQQTAMATQMMGDRDAYLAATAQDVGRRTTGEHWELFVACALGDAMQQQFEHLRPEFIAIHDLGGRSSRRFLAGMAAALGAPVSKLAIRRQGHGVPLATLEFVELPVDEGPPLRLYTTQADADTQQRLQLAHALLAYSRLGVVMVDDLPAHAIASALRPLHDAIVAGPWRNGRLLMLPLSSPGALAQQAAELGAGTGVRISTTPQVMRPADPWNFISGTWSQLRDELQGHGLARLPRIRVGNVVARPPGANPAANAFKSTSTATAAGTAAALPGTPDAARPAPLKMQPMPTLLAPGGGVSRDSSRWADYIARCTHIKGMVSCSVFDVHSERTLAHGGSRPEPAALAAQGAAMLAAIALASRNLGLGAATPELAVTLAGHHLVLRTLPGHPGVVLHAVLDRSIGNLTLARLQLERLDPI
jgi:hypothetical protein